jgi:hypothetical protein
VSPFIFAFFLPRAPKTAPLNRTVTLEPAPEAGVPAAGLHPGAVPGCTCLHAKD